MSARSVLENSPMVMTTLGGEVILVAEIRPEAIRWKLVLRLLKRQSLRFGRP